MSLRFNCKNCRFIYPIAYRCGTEYFKIGKLCSFGRFAVLTAWDNYMGRKLSPNIHIGANCNFGDYLHLTCCNKIIIGDNVLTGRWVTITDNSHGELTMDSLYTSPIDRPLMSKGSVIIKSNVWIGDKVTILPGVTIGTSCIIGANSVVTKDIPDYSIACGNPAKVIKSIVQK